MPVTYNLIASNTLSSAAASVTFSAIPGTYTDLVIRLTARGTRAVTTENLLIQLNSDTATNYSVTRLRGSGTAAESSQLSSQSEMNIGGVLTGASGTADTFGNVEIYLPSYSVAQNKPISSYGVGENNATTSGIWAVASLWRNTAAITSITLKVPADNFSSGSSFFLYGIKNS